MVDGGITLDFREDVGRLGEVGTSRMWTALVSRKRLAFWTTSFQDPSRFICSSQASPMAVRRSLISSGLRWKTLSETLSPSSWVTDPSSCWGPSMGSQVILAHRDRPWAPPPGLVDSEEVGAS